MKIASGARGEFTQGKLLVLSRLLGGLSQDGRKWLGSPRFMNHEVRPFGRGPTTRSLGDLYGPMLMNHWSLIGMILQVRTTSQSILLMVQKSQGQPRGMVPPNPVSTWYVHYQPQTFQRLGIFSSKGSYLKTSTPVISPQVMKVHRPQDL